MAVGDRVVAHGEEFEVVWDGGEGLVAERLTKPNLFWTAPKRIYNKKSDYWSKPKSQPKVDNPTETLETSLNLEESDAVVLCDGGEDEALQHNGDGTNQDGSGSPLGPDGSD